MLMSELTIWTLDWVPEGPRGFVRDLRLRWACEEAGLAYAVRTVPFDDRETNHLDRQPFGQVPFLSDGDVKIFESGACLLHLARKSEQRLPDARHRSPRLQEGPCRPDRAFQDGRQNESGKRVKLESDPHGWLLKRISASFRGAPISAVTRVFDALGARTRNPAS